MTYKQPKDPHNGPITRFACTLIGIVVAICGVVVYAVHHFMK